MQQRYIKITCDRILINGIEHSTEVLSDEIRKDERFNCIQVENRAEAFLIL